jgi:anaerobic magnesium-protoporphyrin IX monomethyl ester cyclase
VTVSFKHDIVFVNPPLSQEERYGVKFKAGGQSPPTGLALLAAICRNAGYRTAIIDAPAQELCCDSVLRLLAEMQPQIVGITAVTVSIFNAMDLARQLKSTSFQGTVVLGGVHVTGAAEKTFQLFGDCYDIAVIGEAEVTVLELIDCIKAGGDLAAVNGIAFAVPEPDGTGSRQFLTAPREYIKELDSLPFPAWDLLPDLGKYYTPPAHTVRHLPAATLITSRGCTGQCVYCDNKVFGNRLRCHSADYVLAMIEDLKARYGIKEFQIRDDNILVFKKRLVELCQKMIDRGTDVAWTCVGRVDMVDLETLKMMKKAGCWQIWYGIESGSDRILKVIKKNTNQAMIRNAVELTKKAGIATGGFFIIGLPEETKFDIEQTMSLISSLPLDDFHINHMTPFPGSEFHENAAKYGFFNDDWKKMSAWDIIFVPHGLTKNDVIDYSNKMYRNFYLRPRIVMNYVMRIRSFNHVKVYFTAFLGFLSHIMRKKNLVSLLLLSPETIDTLVELCSCFTEAL